MVGAKFNLSKKKAEMEGLNLWENTTEEPKCDPAGDQIKMVHNHINKPLRSSELSWKSKLLRYQEVRSKAWSLTGF